MFKVEPIRYLPDDEFEAAKAENEANHMLCRQMNGVCHGYHCGRCGKGVGMMGHGDHCRIWRASDASSTERR